MNKTKILKISIFILCLIIVLLLICFYLFDTIARRTFKHKMISIQNHMDEIDTILNKDNIDIPLFYINLDRSPDRKKFMEDQFKKYNVSSHTRVDAIDSKLLEFKSVSGKNVFISPCKITCINNYNNMTNSEIACTLSHLKAIFTAYNMNYENVIICEDDANFSLSKLWDYKLSDLCNKVPNDWEIIHISSSFKKNYKEIFSVYNSNVDWSASAYIINRKGMKNILDYSLFPNVILGTINNNKIFPHRGEADFYLYEIVNTYVLNIPIIFQNNKLLYSTIGPYDIINKRKIVTLNQANNTMNNFINKIPENIISNNRVVVSFSTMPSRVKYLPNTIKKLNNQKFKPDMIYICIPYFSKRKQIAYNVPENFRDLFINNPIPVTIVRCKDYGPATKLLGCIEYETDPNTSIITIDDDQTYKPDVFRLLVAYSNVYSNSAICFSGMSLDLAYTKCGSNKRCKSFFAEGFAGVLYKRHFISEKMLSYFDNLSYDCFLSDDLVISTWLHIQGIDRIKIGSPDDSRETDSIIDSNDALHRENRKSVYNKCFKEMEQLQKDYIIQQF